MTFDYTAVYRILSPLYRELGPSTLCTVLKGCALQDNDLESAQILEQTAQQLDKLILARIMQRKANDPKPSITTAQEERAD